MAHFAPNKAKTGHWQSANLFSKLKNRDLKRHYNGFLFKKLFKELAQITEVLANCGIS